MSSMLRRLSVVSLESFRSSRSSAESRQEYDDALNEISLDVEEACRESDFDLETVYEVPEGICPARLASKAKRRFSKSDISRGLRVDVKHDVERNAVVYKVSDPRSPRVESPKTKARPE
ncbi:hypothetical protein BDK51DRAFT_39725 [Blyttiomyces helicus]|uniref:Uncharacterized protein n=1 Tax=Blyttiomyces helicus TaxID=388810 RepID=A0A4P9VZE5_9FUNG|nr:hypothetical protein BDK51DRAFT_39725 [Blyttiomyces helicus]|eukprot:RKO83738.1 hypothetical protein BDK51DRAFT_39725 [Blyttiomyces helicus]